MITHNDAMSSGYGDRYYRVHRPLVLRQIAPPFLPGPIGVKGNFRIPVYPTHSHSGNGSREGFGEHYIHPGNAHEFTKEPIEHKFIDPRWKTEAVTHLATAMKHTGDYSALLILSDALMDAGCDDSDIHNHCRLGKPYTRQVEHEDTGMQYPEQSSWVVDKLLE